MVVESKAKEKAEETLDPPSFDPIDSIDPSNIKTVQAYDENWARNYLKDRADKSTKSPSLKHRISQAKRTFKVAEQERRNMRKNLPPRDVFSIAKPYLDAITQGPNTLKPDGS